jgi:hypothetical protein
MTQRHIQVAVLLLTRTRLFWSKVSTTSRSFTSLLGITNTFGNDVEKLTHQDTDQPSAY